MTYEYEFSDIGLTEEQRRTVEIGVANITDLNNRIKEILNQRAKDDWEPLYPFSVPMLWFRRLAKTKKAKKN